MNIKNMINFGFKPKDTLDKKCDTLLIMVKDLAARQYELAKDTIKMQVRMKTLENKLMSVMDNNLKLIELIERVVPKEDDKEDKDAIQVEADDNQLPDGKE